MPDEAGRWTAEHTVMEKDVEIRELKHLLGVKDEKIKELYKIINDMEEENKKLQPKDNYYVDDVDYAAAEEEDEVEEEKQISFEVN